MVGRTRTAYCSDVRRLLWLFHRKVCGLCHLQIMEVELGATHIDHRFPFVYGGGEELDNLSLMHAPCNLGKGVSVSTSDALDYLEALFSSSRGAS